MARKLIRPGGPMVVVKEYLPQAPMGVPVKRWTDCQLALKDKGVPKDILGRITTLRQMNMWVIMVVQIGNPWHVIANHEDELLMKAESKRLLALRRE